MPDRGKYKYNDPPYVTEGVKIGDEFATQANNLVDVIYRLKNELNDINHVWENPDEHYDRYYQEKHIDGDNRNWHNDTKNRTVTPSKRGQKLTVDNMNVLVLYANKIKESLGHLPANLYTDIPELTYGSKASIETFKLIENNINTISKHLNKIWNQSFDTNGYCIKPCQVGCQIGCEIAAQAPDMNGANIYPPNIGIEGFYYAWPGRYYSSRPDPDPKGFMKIVRVNSPLEQESLYRSGRVFDSYSGLPYTHIFGVVSEELERRINNYNWERYQYNLAQKNSNKWPKYYKPYYSSRWLTYVLPVDIDNWLDPNKVIEHLEVDRNGAHNYYRNMPKHIQSDNNYDKYVFVDYDTDYLIDSDEPRYQRYKKDYYLYVKYPKKNGTYKYPVRKSYDDCGGCENK
jgi:hypothetical protein|nr:MAG TPA: hypothetical protein [Caudoviricetes sp.]